MDALYTALFPHDGDSTYAVIDGASCEDLLDKLAEFSPEHFCLYAGELEADVAEVAPYLVRLEPEGGFVEWLLKEGWGKHWGIFVTAPVDLRAMRKHFRSILLVRDAEDETLYFRYYDPRVIRVYLPTCNAAELRLVSAPIRSWVCEDDDTETALVFSYAAGAMVKATLSLG